MSPNERRRTLTREIGVYLRTESRTARSERARRWLSTDREEAGAGEGPHDQGMADSEHRPKLRSGAESGRAGAASLGQRRSEASSGTTVVAGEVKGRANGSPPPVGVLIRRAVELAGPVTLTRMGIHRI